MSEERAVVARTSALDVYGAGGDIKTLADRIKLCLPGGDKLQRHEALALAQLSVAYQLNPFNGEVWYIPGKGTQVGIKGLRKTGHRQAAYWTEFVLLTQDERTQNGVPDRAIAYKCLLYRTDLIRESAAACKAFREAGMADAVDRYAYRPATGIGYWTVGECTKMKGDQAARKRAEADALKQAFDLPFASEVGNGSTVGYVDMEWSEAQKPSGPEWTGFVDGETGEVVEVTPATKAEPTGDAMAYIREAQATADAKPAPIRPTTAENVRASIRKNAGWKRGPKADYSDAVRLLDGEPITEGQTGYVAGLLAQAVPEGGTQAALDNDRHALLNYLCGVLSTKLLTKCEAGATIDWLVGDDPGLIGPWAAAEVAGVLKAAAIAAGQAELL